MCGPLSVEYMTIVSSAMPSSSSSVEQVADDVVVVEHRVVVLRLPPPGPARALRLAVGAEVHVGGVEPHEERRVRPRAWRRMKSTAASRNSSSQVSIRFFVSGPVSSMRWVPSPFAHEWITPARTEALPEVREVLVGRVVVQLGLLLGVEVVEVAEELVEAVHRRQELVAVAEVVLAELAGGVALRLERGRDRRVLGLQADVGARACRPWSSPVRYGFCPVMNAARPAVQLCSP